MTLEPRLLAVHERLERMASSMTGPDIEAGWSAVAAALAPPLAQVVPLPRRSRGRVVLLVAAAALLVTGSALAAVIAHGEMPGHVAPVSTLAPGVPAAGPHLHPVFGGPPAGAGSTTGRPGRDGAKGSGSGGSGSSNGSSSVDSHGHQAGGAPDDPNDRDQGKGNDGAHNDHGGGNDGREGTASPGQAKH